MGNVTPLHPAKPRLIRPAPPHVIAEQRRLDDELNGRFAKGFKHRHYRIGEPIPTKLSDFAAGAAAGFLVGISPFLAMLAVMVFAS